MSRLGLAGQKPMEPACAEMAYQAGINYFFFYNLAYTSFLDGLKPVLARAREQVVLTTGCERRDRTQLQQYLDQVRATLNVDIVDTFFLEYISPKDNTNEIIAALELLQQWKAAGTIRYVGATTHNRDLALELLQDSSCDVLMHRYNMAHRKAEAAVLPAALKANIPVVAFTATRWASLLQGHADWPHPLPTAADCYRMALHQPAIRVVLTAPKTQAELTENLSVLKAPPLSSQEVSHWQAYGDLIYGGGQDSFETQWP